jgi:hypothetical protein
MNVGVAPNPRGGFGIMGAMGDELFTMRQAYSRSLDIPNESISYYPWVNPRTMLGLGAAGTYDEDGYVYYMTGRPDTFLGRTVKDVPALLTKPKQSLPYEETDLDVLPKLPIGFHDIVVYIRCAEEDLVDDPGHPRCQLGSPLGAPVRSAARSCPWSARASAGRVHTSCSRPRPCPPYRACWAGSPAACGSLVPLPCPSSGRGHDQPDKTSPG